MKGDRLYLSNILECIGQIERYVEGGREVFFRDRMVQDAVIRNFEVMGEAVKWLSMELRQENDDVPWRQMAGFRDMLSSKAQSFVRRYGFFMIAESFDLQGLRRLAHMTFNSSHLLNP